MSESLRSLVANGAVTVIAGSQGSVCSSRAIVRPV
jgi:hypothetical protein